MKKKPITPPKPARPCRRCIALSKAVKAFSQETFELRGELSGLKDQLTFYRKMTQDLVDDYLIRRNPFQGERKP